MGASDLRYANDGNPELLALLGARARTVLDVGCGAGDNARLLRQRGCLVDGITIDPDEAEVARAHLRDCWTADLEAGLPEEARARRYDAIICSHVLEHLRNPERLVAALTELLEDGGALLIAVPNVLGWRTRRDFLAGRFEYTETGILDRTHLRFYTFASADRLLLRAAPALELENKSVGGASLPLAWLRRRVLPARWRARADALAGELLPGLFGWQILMRARRVGRQPAEPAAAASDPAAPTISACLLTYDHAHLIDDTVRSVLAQDFTDFELILSDDCSRDGTWERLQALAAADPRVRAVRTPANLGMAGNANFAAAHARGRYVALLHHDDLYHPSLFRRWLEVIERDPAMGFVSNGYANHGSDVLHVSPFAERTDGPAMLDALLSRWDCPFRGTALVRRSAWEAIGGMRERFGLLADVDMWMRLAARGTVGYVAEPLITVRQERPVDYPAEYVGWSWRRLRLLHEIHAANGAARHGEHGLEAHLADARRRLRTSADTAYWLAYAVAKRRWVMLATSDEVESEHELGALRWARRTLSSASRRWRPGTPS